MRGSLLAGDTKSETQETTKGQHTAPTLPGLERSVLGASCMTPKLLALRGEGRGGKIGSHLSKASVVVIPCSQTLGSSEQATKPLSLFALCRTEEQHSSLTGW